MAGIEPETRLEPYQVLTSTIEGKTTYSVIKFDEDRVGNRRSRWVTFIPNAGNEPNAARVVRLLNEEVAANLHRQALRDQAKVEDKEKVLNFFNEPVPKLNIKEQND